MTGWLPAARAARLQQYTLILLVVMAGVIGPVSYFDVYSPHRVSNRYHLSLLEGPARSNQLAHLARLLRVRTAQRFFGQQPALTKELTNINLLNNLQQALSGTWLTTAGRQIIALLLPCPVCRPWPEIPAPPSVDLPPPEKPPPFTV